LSVLEYILQPKLYPMLYGKMHHKVRINYYPPRGDNKEGWTILTFLDGSATDADQGGFPVPGLDSGGSACLGLGTFLDLAQRAGMKGIQEWLSFYFKSPMTAPGLYPEHDLFIQSMKLKNTLRWMMGEDLITHLGRSITTNAV